MTSQHKTGTHPFYIGMYIHMYTHIYVHIYTSQKECLHIFLLYLIIILPFTLEIFDAFWKGFAVPEILQCTCNINKSAQRQLHIEIPRLSVSNAGTIWLKVGLRLGKMSCFTGPVVVMLMMLSLSQMASSKPTWGHHPVCNVILCNIDDAQSESDFM